MIDKNMLRKSFGTIVFEKVKSASIGTQLGNK